MCVPLSAPGRRAEREKVLVMLLLEFALPGVIIFFFGVGAMVVAVICLFADISLNTQLVIFIVSSTVMLLSLRKWLKGIFIGHVACTQEGTENLEDFIGKKVIVTKKIAPDKQGKVEFHGTNWCAEADEAIPAGTTVEIIGKSNITLKVKPLNKEVTPWASAQ